jgi:hypothetical protein
VGCLDIITGPLTTPINRPPGDSLREESSAFTIAHRVTDTFAFFHIWNQVAFGSLIPIFGTHCVRS